MIDITCAANHIVIWSAGSEHEATAALAAYTAVHDVCVTVIPTTFVYDGRAERGVQIGLASYPATPTDIGFHASAIALLLLERLGQRSTMICDRNWHRHIARHQLLECR